MASTPPWRCDSCGGEIADADDGWVEWINVPVAGDRSRARDLRLVHHRSGCQFDDQAEFARDRGTIGDLGLPDFLGDDGLVHLLSLVAGGGHEPGPVITMIQRLHVPGYEQARPNFDRAIAENVIEPNLPPGLHWQRDIRAVIQEYEEEES